MAVNMEGGLFFARVGIGSVPNPLLGNVGKAFTGHTEKERGGYFFVLAK
jgi:hypothetical protein